MNAEEINEFLEYANKKYKENAPRPIRFVVKKAKMIEKFDPSEMPAYLKNCTIEQYIDIIKNVLSQGTLKLRKYFLD